MQLDNIFLKYIPIFNWFGESSVMTSDFQLTYPSPKKRRITNIAIFISLCLTGILSVFNLVVHIKTFDESGKTPHVVLFILFTTRTNTKLCSISQLKSWFNYLPKLYGLFKDIQRVTECRYKLNFCHFQVQFDKEMSIVFSICVIKLIVYFNIFSSSMIECAMTANEAIVLFSNHIIFFHAYFYVLLFKYIMSFYVGYVKHKASFDKPKTSAELKVELVFIKIINFKLHEISKVLNAAFGWIFVLLFIERFFEVMGDAFWIYANMSCENILISIRNYQILLVCFYRQRAKFSRRLQDVYSPGV